MAIILFSDKNNCCGCGACMNICPRNAITMEPDYAGFFYPAVNNELCIECESCKKVCNYQKGQELKEPRKVFAAVNRDKKQLMLSSSGGVFSALAQKILKDGGVVFGATLSFDNGYANPHHIGIESIYDLPKLQGSKYVQSKIGTTYQDVKRYLLDGRTVLFSGTPCQVDGLYGFLKKDYDNLFTIDIICHGVPNEKLFNGYLHVEKKKNKAKAVVGYSFRDKSREWGQIGRLDLLLQNDIPYSVFIPARTASYPTLFLDGNIYRDSCYSCKYAIKYRSADLTIGDYWGIENEHPELLSKDKLDANEGISCVLANSNKGMQLCEWGSDVLQLYDSSFEKVSRKNKQLIEPLHKTEDRTAIMKMYASNGYEAVECWFREKYKIKIMMRSIYYAMPRKLRLGLKRILRG